MLEEKMKKTSKNIIIVLATVIGLTTVYGYVTDKLQEVKTTNIKNTLKSRVRGPYSPNPVVTLEDRPNLALIQIGKESKEEFDCTAFVIDDKYALTAAHCVLDDEGYPSLGKFKVKNHEQKLTPTVAEVAGINLREDAALLVGDFSMFTHLPVDFRGNLLQVGIEGMPTVTCGFPRGGPAICVTQQMLRASGFTYAAIGSIYLPGMSGGPVMGPERNVVGIATYADTETQNSTPVLNLDSKFGIMNNEQSK